MVFIGLYYRGDVIWAVCLLAILIVCWFLNASSFYYLLTSGGHFGLYPRLRKKGVKVLTMLAILNQVSPTLDQDLEDDLAAKNGDENRKRKELNRDVFSAYALLKSFLVMALTSYILSQLMGSEHICLPPNNIFDAPDSAFGSSEFQKYSLQSFIPNKHNSFETVKNASNSKSVFSEISVF